MLTAGYCRCSQSGSTSGVTPSRSTNICSNMQRARSFLETLATIKMQVRWRAMREWGGGCRYDDNAGNAAAAAAAADDDNFYLTTQIRRR